MPYRVTVAVLYSQLYQKIKLSKVISLTSSSRMSPAHCFLSDCQRRILEILKGNIRGPNKD